MAEPREQRRYVMVETCTPHVEYGEEGEAYLAGVALPGHGPAKEDGSAKSFLGSVFSTIGRGLIFPSKRYRIMSKRTNSQLTFQIEIYQLAIPKYINKGASN